MKLEIGQTIYFKKFSFRWGQKPEIVEYKVAKIGRKYFEVDGVSWLKFDIVSLDQAGDTNNPQYKGYLTKQEILDEDELTEGYNTLRSFFQSYGKPKLTLEQVRQVLAIINPKAD